MDAKARSALNRNLAQQLGLSPDKCSDALIAAIERAPGGTAIMEMLNSLARIPARPPRGSASKTLKANIAAATHKLDIPEAPVTTDSLKRQFKEEVKYAAFTRAVVKVLGDKLKIDSTELPQKVENSNPIQDCFNSWATQSGVEARQKNEEQLQEAARKLCTVTGWVPVHTKKIAEKDKDEAADELLLNDVQKAVVSREDHRRTIMPVGGGAVARTGQALQSKVNFRTRNALTKGLSLRSLVNYSFDYCGVVNLEATINAVNNALNFRQHSILDCRERVQAISDRLPKVQNALDQMRLKTNTHTMDIAALREKVIHSRDKITRLSKISFTMRLDAAISSIKEKSRMASYNSALVSLQEEEDIRKAQAAAPVIDPATGFEVPFCQWSERELQDQVKAMLRQIFTECDTLHEMLCSLRQLGQQVGTLEAVTVPEAVGDLRLMYENVMEVSRKQPDLQAKLPKNFLSLISAAAVKESVCAKEQFKLSMTPYLPSIVDHRDLGGLQAATDENLAIIAVKNADANACLSELTNMINESAHLKSLLKKEGKAKSDSDLTGNVSISPPDSDETVSGLQLKPVVEMGSGPVTSFHSIHASTPFVNGGNGNNRSRKTTSIFDFDLSAIRNRDRPA
ncbi:hypothetical protein BV898_12427 [Hypsibius exemplaris]|uniref:Uncharacterized protein n=1 Tax=Hypsibius exemplaris TaxID=2072580 RepID=A0A1W0WDM6_HYPEX|nr:hypothetical protein BV898_12427 [Hypsibius exemplaris]